MADARSPQSRRALSRDSRLVPQRRSAFSSFLSMDSEDGDDGVEEEEDGYPNAQLRIQQRADGSVCMDSSLEMEQIRTGISRGAGENESCGLVVVQQRVFDDAQVDDQWSGSNLMEGVTGENAVPGLSCRKSDGVTKDKAVVRDCGHFCGSWSSELLSTGSHEDSFFDEPRPSFSDEHIFTEADSFTAVDTSFVYRPSLMDDFDESGAQYDIQGEFDSRSFVGRRTNSDEGGNSIGERQYVRPKSLAESGLEDSLNLVENRNLSRVVSKSANGLSVAVGVHTNTLQDDVGTSAVIGGQIRMASSDTLTAQKNGYVYCPASLEADNNTRDKVCRMGSLAKNGDTRAAREIDKLVGGADGDGNAEGENSDVPSTLSMSTSSHSRSSGAVSFEGKVTDSAYRFHDDKAALFAVRRDSSSVTDSCASSTLFKVDKTTALKVPQLRAKVSVARIRAQYEEGIVSRAPADVSVSNTNSLTTAPTCTATSDSVDKSARAEGTNVDYVYASDAFASTSIISGHSLSRQSSTDLSKVSSRQMIATSESWRKSLPDSKNSKNTFDKDVGSLRGGFSLLRKPALRTDHIDHRVESRTTVRSLVACPPLGSTIVVSDHSSANLCIDRSVLSGCSMSLDSRPSGEDSLTKNTIFVDDVGRIEKRGSDRFLSQASGWTRSGGSSDVDLAASASSGSCYNKSVSVADGQVFAMSLDGSIVSSVVSQSLASSDELSFVSFHATQPTTPPGLSRLLEQGAAVEKRLSTPAIIIPGPNEAAHKLERVVCRSIVVPHNSDDKSIETFRSPAVSSAYCTSPVQFSSAALLAAIKTRDVRTDSRPDAMVDVALGSSHSISSSLKINRIPRDQKLVSLPVPLKDVAGISPPLILTPPVMMSLTNRSSVASLAESADRLDFTGVYRGSPNSLGLLGNNGISRKPIQSEDGTRLNKMEQRSLGDRRATSKPKNLERSKSDGRAIQCKARRKVEDFFQRTHQNSVRVVDEREVFRSVNRPKRACTTVVQSTDNVEENPRGNVSHSTKMVRVIDLKNLCSGGDRPGWHLASDALILTPQQGELTEQGAMATTSRSASSGIFTTRSIASAEYITKPIDYVVSPQGTAADGTNVLDTGKDNALNIRDTAKSIGSGSSNFFSVLLDPRESDGSKLGATSGWRAFDVSQTPTMTRGAGSESPAFPVPPSAAPSTTPVEFGGACDMFNDERSLPSTFARAISTFMQKTGTSLSLKQSAMASPFRASGMSFSQRTTFADRMQSLSASVSRAVRRLLPGRDARGPNGIANCTSPDSQCTSPAALRRAYDHNGFYGTPFKVPGVNKPLPQSEELQHVGNDCDWVRQWLLLATCAVLGLSLGAILVRAVAFDSSLFNLSGAEVRDRQESTGQLVLAPGTRWLLLPGRLFLRAWSAVTTPLLVCYVVTAVSDLVGCADKCALVRSSRSMAYALLLAIIATAEGVLAMYLTHTFRWFRGRRHTAQTAASTLSDAIGTTPLSGGAVGLLCSSSDTYLQRLGHDVFTCSNASLTLPLSEGVSTSFPDIADSGPAVFALQDVSSVFKVPTSGAVYYPALLDTLKTMANSHDSSAASVLSARTPHTLVAQSILEKSDRMISLEGLVLFALVLGYICGKRILRLRRDAQAAMFESRRSTSPADGDPQKACHYIVGFSTELQLALEWLIRPIERYLAPVGFFSLMLGHVVLHHREWRSFADPMLSLLVIVMAAFLVHVALVLSMVRTQFCDNRRRLPLLVTTRAFVPAFLFVFTTDNVALSAPVTMQCFARVLTVTRSAAQLITSVTAAFSRNARALYLPLVLLWLLETSSPLEDELKLSAFDYISIGLLSLLSCFCGGSSRLTLAMARTLWFMKVRAQSPETAQLMPATMPLLIVCDVMLSRVASVLTLADHLVLAQLTAQHWGETVVQGRTVEPSNDYMSSFSALDDSQAPCRPSSAMLSSVYL
uniref:Transmembrane protein n=1 Tax=Peronospora matthiolae TaxID=2874970 RepID=A0AAV1UVX6_9STRA